MQKQQFQLLQDQPKYHKNKYQFPCQHNNKIIIDSDFDNGNIALIRQVTDLHYRLQAISDSNLSANKKTWFHFRVSAPNDIRIRFIIQNINIYENMYEQQNWAKPVVNDGQGWRPIKDCFLTYRGEVGIVIDYTFHSQNNTFIYFAMSVPFTYEDCQKYLKYLKNNISPHIQYHDEILTQSYGGLNLHLLKLTSKQCKNNLKHPINQNSPINSTNPRIHSEPNLQNTPPQILKNIKKPIIFITCRVHPGEVGSSYCLLGILDFLTRQLNLQSYILLKMFQILIIPLVNPDGVYEGNYRMDLNNNNLNRLYQDPSPDQHPTIYKIKQLFTALAPSKQKSDKIFSYLSNKIMFHFDLHSHSSIKSAFIYGNAFDQIIVQTQSELFCKLLQQNSNVFKYECSCFGQKHMKMKDKGQPLTKQGCARVVLSKMANVIYSYTVETSIFPYLTKSTLQPQNNTNFQLSDHLAFLDYKPSDITQKHGYKNQLVLDNMLLGYGLMISILDLLQKNPYSRFSNLQQTIDQYRKQIAQNIIQCQQRFKQMDVKAYQKVKNITIHCRQQFTNKYKKYWQYLWYNKQFITNKWPSSFKHFSIITTPTNNNYIDKESIKKRNKTTIENYNEFDKYQNDQSPKYDQQYIDSQLSHSQHNSNPDQKYRKLSPSKIQLSYRHIQDTPLHQNAIKTPTKTSSQNTYYLLSTKKSFENQQIYSSSNTSFEQPKNITKTILTKKQDPTSLTKIKQTKQFKKIKQLTQIKQLHQKQQTKNIILSFILQQMEKMNSTKKDFPKSKTLVNNRFANFKFGKKTAKSTKILQKGRFAKNVVQNPERQHSQQPHQNPIQVLIKDQQVPPQRYNKQKIDQHIRQQQQKEYQQQQGIYSQKQQKQQSPKPQKQKQKQPQKLKNRKLISSPIKKSNLKRNAQSLQKFLQYPLYPIQNTKQPLIILQPAKKQLTTKIKFSQLKRKNIIRQDIINNIKLPQLKTTANFTSRNKINTLIINQSQHQNPNNKININLYVNGNANINGNKITARSRSITVPDQTI